MRPQAAAFPVKNPRFASAGSRLQPTRRLGYIRRMQRPSPALSTAQVLLFGAAIVTLSMGIRHGFGLWLQPITMERGWTREHFALAMAVQNITWGAAGLFAGMLADRLGSYRVLLACGFIYALGLVLMAVSPTPVLFVLTAGVLIGTCHLHGSFIAKDNKRPAMTVTEAVEHPQRDYSRIVLPPMSFAHEQEKTH